MKSYAWLATKGHMPYINNKDQGIMYIVLAASPVKYNKCNNIDVAFFISHHKTRFEMCLTKEKKVGGVEFSFFISFEHILLCYIFCYLIYHG